MKTCYFWVHHRRYCLLTSLRGSCCDNSLPLKWAKMLMITDQLITRLNTSQRQPSYYARALSMSNDTWRAMRTLRPHSCGPGGWAQGSRGRCIQWQDKIIPKLAKLMEQRSLSFFLFLWHWVGRVQTRNALFFLRWKHIVKIGFKETPIARLDIGWTELVEPPPTILSTPPGRTKENLSGKRSNIWREILHFQ